MAITEKACEQIVVLEERILTKEERCELQKVSEKQRREGIDLANQICRDYRREGSYFDEKLSKGERL